VEEAQAAHGAELASERFKKLDRLLSRKDELDEEEKKLTLLQDQADAARRHWEEKQAMAFHGEQLFFASQAGLLAETLEEGKACPVCGAVHHPRPATLQEGAPTQAALNKMKKELQEAEQVASQRAQEAGQQKSRVDTLSDTLFEQAREVLPEATVENLCDLLFPAWQQAQTAEQDAKEGWLAAKHRVREKNELTRKKAELLKQVEELSQQETECQNVAQQTQTQVQVLTEKVRNLRQGLRFEQERQAKANVKALTTQVNTLDQQIKNSQKALQTCQQALNGAEGQLAGLESQQSQPLTQSALELENQRKGLEEERKRLEDQRLLLTGRSQRNRAGRDTLQKLKEDWERTRKIVERRSLLADAANGTLKGQAKLAFEQYLQAAYFDRILQEANRRFYTLSSGQFQLVRSREASGLRSQTGLDLNVLDHYTGRERSVKTLSGGESFLAALSLALGLSDVIQRENGGIRLEAMFVDEGFGSLDEDALAQAIRVLSQLAGDSRMVGIISHVSELRDNIPHQIQVKRSRTGSSLTQITE
jgi:exonuclease SbcC